jgi:predicted PP-loop superfamily ATPase
VRIAAIGEGQAGEMFDYGWIEDVDKGANVCGRCKRARLLMQVVRVRNRTVCRPTLIFGELPSIKNEALDAT